MTKDSLYQISRNITAPAMLSYVEWILADARMRGLKRLYFLARDGYTLMRIARAVCEKNGFDIDCRYLYCSRAALRTPSYHIIGEEAFDLLFLFGFHVTPESFFERADVPDALRRQILDELGLTDEDARRELLPMEMEDWKARFRANETYCRHVQQFSRAAYDDAIAYFRQEGLLDGSPVALVDSGWSGSMQRSLRQLLASAGFAGTIIGYYFGMYADPREAQDGTYLTYFFARSKRVYNKLFFNNNLFECMLTAPHGMTLGYAQQDGRFIPVLGDLPAGAMAEAANTQLRGILDGVDDALCLPSRGAAWAKSARARLRRLMVCPSRKEADAFSAFLFCDDITEKHHYALADAEQLACIPEHALYKRIWRKLTRRRLNKLFIPFWIYGTLAYIQSPVKRSWLWLNVWLWDALRYLLHRA